MRRIRALPIRCMVLSSLVGSCRAAPTADAIEKSPDAIAERGPSGTSTWIIQPDGKVSATLKTPDGKRVAHPVTGQVAFAPPNGPPMSVPVQYDPTTGVLTAAGPRLEADITPVSYTLTSGVAPWTGSIDVPRGGTPDLVATGRPQAPLASSVVGPNGGIVQTVGPDRIELVANKHTGDVRAYVLDADDHTEDPGDRRITIAVPDEPPEVLVLAPDPQAHFFVGHMRARVDPAYLTVAVNVRGTTHASLVGWSPGSVVVVGPEAPRVHLFAVDAWPGEVVEVRGRHGKHHDEVVGAAGVVVGTPGVVVEAPSVVVRTPGVVVGAPGVVVGGPGVVVGGPGVVVGGPGVVIGGPGVVVGGPGLVVGPGGAVGAGVEVHGPGPGRSHDRDRGHGR